MPNTWDSIRENAAELAVDVVVIVLDKMIRLDKTVGKRVRGMTMINLTFIVPKATIDRTMIEAILLPQTCAEQLEKAVEALPDFVIPLDDAAALEALRRALCARVMGNLRALGVDAATAGLLIEGAFVPVLEGVIRFHRHAGHA